MQSAGFDPAHSSHCFPAQPSYLAQQHGRLESSSSPLMSYIWQHFPALCPGLPKDHILQPAALTGALILHGCWPLQTPLLRMSRPEDSLQGFLWELAQAD